jgi:hypothetical protein
VRALVLLRELLLLELAADQPRDQPHELHVALVQPGTRAVADAGQGAEVVAVPQLDRLADVCADTRLLGARKVLDPRVAPRVGDEAIDAAGEQLAAVRPRERDAQTDPRTEQLGVAADGENLTVACARIGDVRHVHRQQQPHGVQGTADGVARGSGDLRHGTKARVSIIRKDQWPRVHTPPAARRRRVSAQQRTGFSASALTRRASGA